ncbi:MAG: helix-turn-helix transcriptional regulator [Sphaerochaetaceae bacterium]|nr:helix-turn-helix transcriptional regulator [Sphaerochaetaceae bacterium]MDC7237834.1 helix-turn-helix transcriptional regulator [Sphaerochaetaceae bacterium]MDC7251039.1 helix-turn-helix transcriptional regulator [Sphaerochaetaceae bacterium]
MIKEIALTETTFYILLALRHPNHGYGIIQEVEKLTSNRVVLGAGTLYGALNSLMKKNWIELYSEEISSRKKKQYIITDLGRQAFEREVIRLKELINCSKLMEDLND